MSQSELFQAKGKVQMIASEIAETIEKMLASSGWMSWPRKTNVAKT